MEILHWRLHHFDLQQELVSAEIFLCRFLQWLEVLLDQTKIIAMDALNSRVVVLLSLVLCFQAKKVKLHQSGFFNPFHIELRHRHV